MLKRPFKVIITVMSVVMIIFIIHFIIWGATDHDVRCGFRTTTITAKNGTKKVIKEAGCEG